MAVGLHRKEITSYQKPMYFLGSVLHSEISREFKGFLERSWNVAP